MDFTSLEKILHNEAYLDLPTNSNQDNVDYHQNASCYQLRGDSFQMTQKR